MANRGFGNTGFAAGNRFNSLSQTSFASNRSAINNWGGGFGGYRRSWGGYGRGFGYGYPGFGFGPGRFGPGFGGYPFGFGFGGYPFGFGFGGFPLGFLLGLGLGGWGNGFGLGGYGLGGFGGYGGYGGWGYPAYSYGDYGGYGGWGYPAYGYPGTANGYAVDPGTLYSYGYLPYTNPYAVTTTTGAAFDYSQPISTVSAAPAQSALDESLALFSAARDSFKAGNVGTALQQADSALTRNPQDTSLHEFRALCLFALGRYEEAAAPLYAVLSVGPGWDWPTLASLYPNVDVYTAQLRTLEAYVKAHPQSSAGRFLLAYHYMTTGHGDFAVSQLKELAPLLPNAGSSATAPGAIPSAPAPRDTPAAPIPGVIPPAPALRDTPAAGGAPAPIAPGAAPDAAGEDAKTAPPEGATIEGTWTAKPAADASIVLKIQPDGAFDWQYTAKGQSRDFAGTSTFGNGILTLAPDKPMPPMVGRVTWTDANHMTFRIVGEGPGPHGLSFSK
jgi:tetratricopeptide (TPR) repeat protein